MRRLLAFFLLILVIAAGIGAGMIYIGVMPVAFYDYVHVYAPEAVANAIDEVADAIGGSVPSIRVESQAPVTADAEAVPADAPRRPDEYPQIVDAVIDGVQLHQEGIVIPVVFPDGDDDSVTEFFLRQVELAVDEMRREMPQIFWLSLGSYNIEWNGNRETREGSLTVHLSYCHSEEDAKELQDTMNFMVDELVSAASDDPVYAVEYFHNWIIDNTVYASELAERSSSMQGYEYGFNMDGVFIHGSAVCEGYSKAFKMLCERAGIPCESVFGVANGEKHSWNYVRIEDSWYLVDVTWDDPVGPEDMLLWDYFLLGRDSIIDGQRVTEIYRQDYADYPSLSENGYYEKNGVRIIR